MPATGLTPSPLRVDAPTLRIFIAAWYILQPVF